MEILDIVDEYGQPVGETVEREKAHAQGIRHRTAHVWIVRQNGNHTEVLLQKRSLKKDSFPGKYDTSSAGHIPAGDEPGESALRELQEELGIFAQIEDLQFVDTFPIQFETEFYGKVFRDNEIAFVYIYKKPVDISNLVLQKEELDDVQWFEIEYVYRQCLAHDRRFCVPVGGLELVRKHGIMTFQSDYNKASQAFEEYLNEYNRQDDKIHLKIVHTYGVVDCAEEICRRMKLSDEDVQLAKIIALLHDIGRFEQLKRFNSFEPGTMSHAHYGVEILFGPEKMIRRFVPDSSFDELICTAIEKHSDFQLEGVTDTKILLHARLIRDADKLDNCRVKLEESMETLLDVDEKTVGEGKISDRVWQSCMEQKPVLSSDRITKVDYWVSYVAQYFDINFPQTFQIMKEHDYIKKIVDRIPYAQQDTREKMNILERKMETYMDTRTRRN